MANAKETSPEMAALASKVLSDDYEPTDAEIMSLAACVLSQASGDEEE